MLGSVIGVIVLVVDIWAILNVVQSRESTGGKAFWIILVLVLPMLGAIIWLVGGPRKA